MRREDDGQRGHPPHGSRQRAAGGNGSPRCSATLRARATYNALSRTLPDPVLYLLHGASGNETSWPEGGGVEATADRLIAGREIPAIIIVMPGHSNGWWVDGNNEPASSVVLEELIPHVDGSDVVVPFYLLSGDDDELGIAEHTTALFDRLRSHQADSVELHSMDGGHDWSVWRAALPGALRFLCRFVASPDRPAR